MTDRLSQVSEGVTGMSTGLESKGGIFHTVLIAVQPQGRCPTSLSVIFLIYDTGLTVHGVALMAHKRLCFLPPGIQERVWRKLNQAHLSYIPELTSSFSIGRILAPGNISFVSPSRPLTADLLGSMGVPPTCRICTHAWTDEG